MTDIVERLRRRYPRPETGALGDLHEAADEIERLRAEVKEATRHAVELEQCSIFAADVGDSIAKAMTDAAHFLRSLTEPSSKLPEGTVSLLYTDVTITFSNRADAEAAFDIIEAMIK